MKQQLTLKLQGTGAAVDTVPLNELLQYLALLDEILRATVRDHGRSIEEPFLTLTSVSSGSHVTVLKPSQQSAEAAAWLGARSRTHLYPANTHDLMYRLSQTALANGRSIDVTGSGFDMKPVHISKEAPVPQRPETTVISGETTVYGKIVRLNANKRDGTLAMSNGASVTLKNVGPPVDAQLGTLWLQPVRVHGLAHWDAGTLELLSITPDSVTACEESSTGFLDALRKLDSSPFEGKSVTDIMAELRGPE